MLAILTCALVLVMAVHGEDVVELKMPNVHPSRTDLYLCHSMDVSKHGATYVTGYRPRKTPYTHHMLIYTCDSPPPARDAWDCGEMHSDGQEFSRAPICQSVPKLIYAWAMDAPGLTLPPDVSFKIGDTAHKYLVLQVHYKVVDDFKKNPKLEDNSGVDLVTTSTPTGKAAGIYLLVTDGVIPPKSTIYMEAACKYDGAVTLHPFAYRTHAHFLGEVISGYVIHHGEWTEIGRKSPRDPQMFYNATHSDVVVKPRDILAARCVMKNPRKESVWIGATMKDEMCNFYMMYWVPRHDESRMPDGGVGCSTAGWPLFRWDQVMDISGMPESAALPPGQEEPLSEELSPAAERIALQMEEKMVESGGAEPEEE